MEREHMKNWAPYIGVLALIVVIFLIAILWSPSTRGPELGVSPSPRPAWKDLYPNAQPDKYKEPGYIPNDDDIALMANRAAQGDPEKAKDLEEAIRAFYGIKKR